MTAGLDWQEKRPFRDTKVSKSIAISEEVWSQINAIRITRENGGTCQHCLQPTKVTMRAVAEELILAGLAQRAAETKALQKVAEGPKKSRKKGSK